ncbi:hypothetical protein GCM10023081_27210 [Arthrobacter ginkgonis]|uniref:CHAT domain-containing protein n=1 Tax=Arthrobacter ginkgonis TaxID=1630594 RepID=A0ABP7CHT0_9MICC
MALFKNDVSEYVTPGRVNPARLVVTFTPVQGSPDRYDVTAQVDDDGELMTGEFVARPEWRNANAPFPTSKIYPAEPPRAQLGTQLFSNLFSGALSRCWAQAVERGRQRGLHILIRSSSYALHALPWELLSDPAPTSSEYVAFSEGWSVLRDVPASGEEAMPGIGAPVPAPDLAILVMTTAVTGVNQDSDPGIIRAAFPQTPDVRTIPDAGPEQILEALEAGEAQVAHIMGTGEQTRQGWQDLVVGTPGSPTVLPGKALAKAMEDTPRLRLVVLAACETDRLAAHLAPVVPAVIGIRGIISDAGCQAFLGGLYGALAAGATLSQAVASGRTQQIGFSQSIGDEWAQPVLFLHEDGSIVRPRSHVEDTMVTVLGLRNPTTQAGTEAETAASLLLQIKEENLRALRTQWGEDRREGGQGATPAFVQKQIDHLAEEVEGMGEARRGALP